MKLAAEFSEPLNKLVQFQTRLTLHLGDLGVLVRDFVTGPKGSQQLAEGDAAQAGCHAPLGGAA
jgi:hypothetical protein